MIEKNTAIACLGKHSRVYLTVPFALSYLSTHLSPRPHEQTRIEITEKQIEQGRHARFSGKLIREVLVDGVPADLVGGDQWVLTARLGRAQQPGKQSDARKSLNDERRGRRQRRPTQQPLAA